LLYIMKDPFPSTLQKVDTHTLQNYIKCNNILKNECK
jgi:hypothetical protein